MRLLSRAGVVLVLVLAACGEPAPVGEPESTTTAALPTTTEGRTPARLIGCEDIEVPSAPEDWYAETPIYVGNEAPVEEIRSFASGLAGFRDVWIDSAHNRWVGVGFDAGTDVEAIQAVLAAEFPGIGVVAVEMAHTPAELAEVARDLDARLPEGMLTAGVYEVQGYVEVVVGLLTPENIAAASEVVGDAPACLSGRDPSTTPAPGPQADGGDGWTYLGEADTMLEADAPVVLATVDALDAFWQQLGMGGGAPAVDFERQVVLALVIGHSGSCPVTRLDDIVVDGDLVYAVIPTITEDMGCTADWNPRTYLVAVDRQVLPPPPFQLTAEVDYGSRVEVATDLRIAGSVPAEGEVRPISPEAVRQPTTFPLIIETGFPWTVTLDPSCGIDHLGEINGVHWDRAEGSGVPEEWKAATVDELLDLELLLTEGPAPTLTASAGGLDILYLPGAAAEPAC